MKPFSALQAWLAWAWLCLVGTANADVVVRGFDPALPNSAQVPSLVLDVLYGSGITTCERGRTDVPAKVSVQGSVILVKLYMYRIGTGNPSCLTDPSSIGLRWPLESVLPAGSFSVRVFGSPQSFEPFSTAPDFLLGELPVRVSAAPIQVPAAGLPQLIALSFALLLMGIWRLRH